MVSDQDAGEGAGIFAPLFGKLANTMVLGPRLAARTGSPVFVCWAERLPGRPRYRIHLVEAPPEVGGEDLLAAASALNRMAEKAIRALPEQWLWSYKRYRVRPVGLASPYDGRVTIDRGPA